MVMPCLCGLMELISPDSSPHWRTLELVLHVGFRTWTIRTTPEAARVSQCAMRLRQPLLASCLACGDAYDSWTPGFGRRAACVCRLPASSTQCRRRRVQGATSGKHGRRSGRTSVLRCRCLRNMVRACAVRALCRLWQRRLDIGGGERSIRHHASDAGHRPLTGHPCSPAEREHIPTGCSRGATIAICGCLGCTHRCFRFWLGTCPAIAVFGVFACCAQVVSADDGSSR